MTPEFEENTVNNIPINADFHKNTVTHLRLPFLYILYPERSLAIEENRTPMLDIIKVKQKSSY